MTTPPSITAPEKFLAAIAVLALLIAPFSPAAQDLALRLKPPDATHWLGTDELSRDIFSRLLYGARVTLGIVALVWTLDCFVGFYLTLPRGQGGFWKRWKYAWQVKWRASGFRINFDLHRAGGLWFWVLLFVFAWSSVMLSLRPVYDRVTKAVFDYRTDDEIISSVTLKEPLDNPKLGWREAQTLGERAMAQIAAQHGFKVTRPYGMAYIPEFGVYTYAVRGSNDIRGEGWDTSIWVDGNTGGLRDVSLPFGQHAGNTVSTVLWGLHYGDIRNFLPYRILVAFFGLVLTVISGTGVYIWWKKRAVQKKASEQRNWRPRTSGHSEVRRAV